MLQRADENQQVASQLREAADLLEAQGANPFRVAAYRKAGDTLAGLGEPVRRVFEQRGREGLDALPNVGAGIAGAIAEMLITGRWAQLERLRGAAEPEELFRTVPGVGPALAKMIHDGLHADTLEQLEAAAYDGRLERVRGVGARRAAAIRAALASMLGRRIARAPRPSAAPSPEVAELLEMDRRYREKAEAGELPRIAPKRFNPEGEAWLPVLHARRGRWNYTVLYSNTARAHELGRTRDWVVIYFYDDDHVEGQHTVVTEMRGPLVGRRVVRGREHECRDVYEMHETERV
jgi:hypothetical protein